MKNKEKNYTMKELFLSQIDIVSRLKPHGVNLIYAPVGSGKTSWVNDKLIKSVDSNREILYLIDTTAGRDQIINDNHDLVTNYSDQWELWMNGNGRPTWGAFPENRVPVMTFSKLAWAIKRNDGLGTGGLKHIVLDECQNLKIFQKYGNKEDENVLKLLEHWIKFVIRNTNIKVTALSATPRQISKMFPENDLHHVLTEEEKASLKTLKNGFSKNYVSIKNILSNLPNGKIVIYTAHIGKMKEFCEIIKARDNRNVEMIWSRNNEKHELSERQREIWNSILTKAIIPNDIDILMFNAACLTGVNIKSPVDYVIVHDSDEDNQIQARGRVRSDVKGLYVPRGDYIVIPDKFIGHPLYKAEKEELAKAANVIVDGHMKKFSYISKSIRNSRFYCFELTKSGKEAHRNREKGKDLTYHIIKKQEKIV